MAIPPGTPSLLMTLLEDLLSNPYNLDPAVQENIASFVNVTQLTPQGSVIRSVAQKELYDVLYEIIKKEYDDPGKDQRNLIFNSAIGMALEKAISGELKNSTEIIELRTELRKKIIEALTPK